MTTTAIEAVRQALQALERLVARLEQGEASRALAADCTQLRGRVEVLIDSEHRRLWGLPGGDRIDG